MKERLCVMKEVLKDTGSIFLHCDDSASWYLKIVMDEIFGEDNFRSEIVWTFKRWSNSKKGLLANHQTIFFVIRVLNTNLTRFTVIIRRQRI